MQKMRRVTIVGLREGTQRCQHEGHTPTDGPSAQEREKYRWIELWLQLNVVISIKSYLGTYIRVTSLKIKLHHISV